jgi:cytochrome bd-type quinol oxidase subunit 2
LILVHWVPLALAFIFATSRCGRKPRKPSTGAGFTAQVTLIVWGWALTQYPYLIRPHLTFRAAAAPRATLVLLLQVLACGAAVVLPSLVYLFRIFGPRQLDAGERG